MSIFKVSSYALSIINAQKCNAYLVADDANVCGEVDADKRAIDELMLVPLKMVLGVGQQATTKPHRLAGVHRLVPRTSRYDWSMRQPR